MRLVRHAFRFCLALLIALSLLGLVAPTAQAALAIDNIKATLQNGSQLIVTWSTNEASGSTAHLLDIGAGSPYAIHLLSETTGTSHRAVFENLPPQSQHQLWITASNADSTIVRALYPTTIDLSKPAGIGVEADWSKYSPAAFESSSGPGGGTGPGGGPAAGFQPPYIYVGNPPAATSDVTPIISVCEEHITVLWRTSGSVAGTAEVINEATDRVIETKEFSPMSPVVVHFIKPDEIPGTIQPSVNDLLFFNMDMIAPQSEYRVEFDNGRDQGTLRPAAFNSPDKTAASDCKADDPFDFLRDNGVEFNAAYGNTGGGPLGPGGTAGGQAGPNPNTFFEKLVTTELDNTKLLGDLLYNILLPIALLTILLVAYFFIKRRRLWGIVYDARTKEPVELAVVRLFDQEHHKLLETRVTSKAGRYSFLAEPGEFYLDVTKEGYHFPSRIVTSTVDNEYTNLYRGEMLKLGAGQSLIAPDIPIDSESGEVKKASVFRRVLLPILDKLRLPLLLLSLLTSAFLWAGNYAEFQDGADDQLMGAENVLTPLVIILIILILVEFFMIRRGRK